MSVSNALISKFMEVSASFNKNVLKCGHLNAFANFRILTEVPFNDTFAGDVVLKLKSPIAGCSLLWWHGSFLSPLLLCLYLLQVDRPLVECGSYLPRLLVIVQAAQHLGKHSPPHNKVSE